MRRGKVEVRIGTPLIGQLDSYALTDAWGTAMDGLLAQSELAPARDERPDVRTGAEEGI